MDHRQPRHRLLFFTLSGLTCAGHDAGGTGAAGWQWSGSAADFLWSLHSVAGTWVLLIYLMCADRPVVVLRLVPQRSQHPAVAPVAKHKVAADAALDLSASEATLYALPGVRTGYIDLRLPEKPGQVLNVRDAGDPSQRGGRHDRAHDLLQLIRPAGPSRFTPLRAPGHRRTAGHQRSHCTRAVTSACPGGWW